MKLMITGAAGFMAGFWRNTASRRVVLCWDLASANLLRQILLGLSSCATFETRCVYWTSSLNSGLIAFFICRHRVFHYQREGSRGISCAVGLSHKAPV